jgi:predicted Zn-dependent peptidase
VPQPLLLMAFYLPPRSDADFPVCDMLSDLLANGKSSRFNQHLVEQRQLFLSLDAYVDGRLGTGQLMIEGIPADGVTMAEAEAAVWEELQAVQRELVGDEELQKLKNRFETTFELQISDYQRLAEQLAYYEMLGDAHRLFDEVPSYQAIDSERLRTVARRILAPANACVLHYLCSADS